VNCKFNESSVFSQAAVSELLRRYVLVQLYTDVVPSRYQPTTSAEENTRLQREEFGSDQLPLYVILRPTNGKYEVVGQYVEGKINDVEGFKKFLRDPLEGTGK
jgi:hypothetical protein